MNDNKLQQKLDEIAAQHSIFDTLIPPVPVATDDGIEWEHRLDQSQLDLVRKLFDLFGKLRWQLALNEYKRLEYDQSPPIKTDKCGTAVRVRPCGDEYEGKTYFGVLIGEVPLGISSRINSEGTLTVMRSMYNPAIFVPALGEIIYGAGSWWSEIDPDQEIDQITDEMIGDVWYVKMMVEMAKGKDKQTETT